MENAKAVYELIVRRMSEELARFQRERAAELAAVLRSFAMAQAQLAGDTANVSVWPMEEMLHCLSTALEIARWRDQDLLTRTPTG